MTSYGVLLCLHVIVAILGVGQLAALAVTGASADAASLVKLIRNGQRALLAMFVTGAGLDFLTGGAFHERVWFRGSGLLLLLIGILSWRAQKAARAGQARLVRGFSLTMCALVAVVTVLMEQKPL